jgi:hypothetical protein
MKVSQETPSTSGANDKTSTKKELECRMRDRKDLAKQPPKDYELESETP